MPYLICDNELEANTILAQVKNEGWDGWTTKHHHPETGKVAMIMPGYTDYAKFNREVLEDSAAAEEAGYISG